MKRALITGSDGFIGRHFCKHLFDFGWSITPIDIAAKNPTSRMDVRDFFREFDSRYDLVVHCAAVIGGRAMIDGSPLQLAAEDLSIDAEMWRWALCTKPGRIVYFSSSAAYPIALQTGRPPHVLTEDDINLDSVRNPDMTYGWVKLTGEQLAHHATRLGLNVTVLRPFSGYGADQDDTYPFPAIINRAHRREDPFVLWGPGTQVRDWIHVDDVIAGTMAVVDQGVTGPVNLCTGRPTSFLELAGMVTKASGYSPRIEPLPHKPTGVQYRVGDPTLMHTLYKPRICLEDGIEQALAKL